MYIFVTIGLRVLGERGKFQPWGLWQKTVFLIQEQPHPCCAPPTPQPKTPSRTFVNAHTISHYL